MAQGSGFRSRGALRAPIAGDIRAPGSPSGAPGAADAAQTFNSLAGQFDLLGRRLVERDLRENLEAEKQAGAEAGAEAARSGQALVPREVGFFSRREDQAFNAAAEVGYAQGLEVQIEARRRELEMEHEADPEGFMQAWDAYQADVMKRVPSSLQQRIGLVLDQHANRGDFALARQQKERADAMAALNVRQRADQLTREVLNAARQSGNPMAAAESIAALQQSVGEAVQTGLLTPAQGDAILTNARDGAFMEGYMGAFERDPSAAGLQAFVEADTPELTPRNKDILAGRMQSHLERLESAARAADRQLRADVSAAIEATDAGIPLTDDAKANLLLRTAGTEYEVPLRLTLEVAEQARSVSQLTLQEQQQRIAGVRAEIDRLQSTPVEGEEADEAAFTVARLAKFHDQLAKSYARTLEAIDDGHAMDRAAELGVVDIEPLDFSGNEEFGASLDQRLEDALLVEEHFGLRPGSILTAQEIDGLGGLLRPGAAPTETQIALLQGMTAKLGSERMVAIMEQVAEKEPEIAFAAGLSPDLMGAALTGRAILAENPQVAPGAGETAAREVISEVYGAALAGNPRTVRNATEVARWLYASRMAQQGDLTGQLNTEVFEQALHDAVGGVIEWENERGLIGGDDSVIVPPRPGMTGDEFADLMDSLSDADLRAGGQVPVTARGQPVSAATLRRLGKLRSIGDGQYAVTLGEFGLIDQSGRPYVLDLGAVLARPAQERALDRIGSMTLEELQALDIGSLTSEQAMAVAARAAELAQ